MPSPKARQKTAPRTKDVAPKAVKATPAAARAAAPKPNGASRRPTTDQVARRAYEIWEAEGRPGGREREHWVRAEADLDSSHPD